MTFLSQPPNPQQVIEAFKKDIDRTLIRENLKLTHEERLLKLMELQHLTQELHHEGRRARREGVHYRKLASLQKYVRITQDAYHIEHYRRQPDNQWLLSESDNVQDTIHLPSIDCHLAVADVYDKVEVEAE